jgi:hypothetical protein
MCRGGRLSAAPTPAPDSGCHGGRSSFTPATGSSRRCQVRVVMMSNVRAAGLNGIGRTDRGESSQRLARVVMVVLPAGSSSRGAPVCPFSKLSERSRAMSTLMRLPRVPIFPGTAIGSAPDVKSGSRVVAHKRLERLALRRPAAAGRRHSVGRAWMVCGGSQRQVSL